MNFVVTGGSGKLGVEFQKYFKALYPTKQEMNITSPPYIFCEGVIHMAAYTNVDKAEIDEFNCFYTNVIGTYKMLETYWNLPFVFISTEHVNAPGVYFESKLVGEILVRNLAKKYLIIRTLFKPNPWPFEYAFTDQWTQGDYVDVIAPLIAKAIKDWDQESKIIYVGTGRKTMFELAKRTKPDVKPNSIKDMAIVRPGDYL